jgi:hypothetical protein
MTVEKSKIRRQEIGKQPLKWNAMLVNACAMVKKR